MKAKLFLLLAVFSTLPLFSARSQTVITFDDLPFPSDTNIPNGYQGLNWSNFYFHSPEYYGWSNGYHYGLVSPPQ